MDDKIIIFLFLDSQGTQQGTSMEKIHFRAITCLSFLQAQQYGGREKQEHNDIVKFSSLKGKAARRLPTECCDL